MSAKHDPKLTNEITGGSMKYAFSQCPKTFIWLP